MMIYDDELCFFCKVLSISLCSTKVTKTLINHIKITLQKYQQNMFSHVPPFFPMIFPRFSHIFPQPPGWPRPPSRSSWSWSCGAMWRTLPRRRMRTTSCRRQQRKRAGLISHYITELVLIPWEQYGINILSHQYQNAKGYEPILMG